jgi:cell division protein FtsW
MVYSASSVYAQQHYNSSTFFLKRHLVFVLIGSLFTFIVMYLDYRLFQRLSKPLLLLSLALLVLVLIPNVGRAVAGARRWFRWGSISFQPSELMNLVFIIYTADFICRKRNILNEFNYGLAPIMLILGLTAALIFVQPDLGTAVGLALIVFLMLFVAGIRFSYLAGILILSVPLLYALILSAPYRKMRIITFLNPWLDPKGSGFQLIQSNIALASGGFFGVGLGKSMQKLFYLPAAHTDFIFSIIAEELGLLGALGVCLLFINFIIQGIRVIKNTTDMFGYYLATGIVLMIGLRALINMGVCSGILPTKGLPLPFISYGGSSLIFDMVAVGLLLNIARDADQEV